MTIKSSAVAVSQSNSTELGLPYVDIERVIEQLTQSNSSFERTIKEYTENAIDSGATRVDIRVLGTRDGSDINISEIIVKDDGCGMSHTTFMKNFRALCSYNFENHEDPHKHGKNGLGAKTGLSEFRYLEVSTTTAGCIETFPEDGTDASKETKEVFGRHSQLKSGDLDTEMRSYCMERTKAKVLTPWGSCDAAEHGTTIRLYSPKLTRVVKINEEKLIKLLQTHFQWLADCARLNEQFSDTGKREKRGMFLVLPGDAKAKEILSFDNGWSANDYNRTVASGAYLTVTGSLGKGLSFKYMNPEGMLEDIKGKGSMPPIIVPPQLAKTFGLDSEDVHVWLQLTYGVDSRSKELLISVSGSIVELPRKLLNSVKHGGGLDIALRGKIYTNNPMLKKALRGNRTQTDQGDPAVVAMWDYIYKIFQHMSDYYNEFMMASSNSDDDTIIHEALASLSSLFDKTSDGSGKTPESPNVSTRWVCLSCNHVFDFPNGKKPYECPTGCGGTDFALFTPEEPHGTSSPRTTSMAGASKAKLPFSFERVQPIGNWVPMRFNSETSKFEIVANHPEYTQECVKNKWVPMYRERLVQHCIVALAAAKAGEMGADGKVFLEAFSGNLKKVFMGNKKRKDAVLKKWKEIEGPAVTLDIF